MKRRFPNTIILGYWFIERYHQALRDISKATRRHSRARGSGICLYVACWFFHGAAAGGSIGDSSSRNKHGGDAIY